MNEDHDDAIKSYASYYGGIKNPVKDQVKLLVNLGIKAGFDGVIASAQDFSLIRSLSKDLKIF